jgi:phosphohistidine phosphatase
MKLYLVRHATAEDALYGQNDHSRTLTPEGRVQFEAVVQGLKQLGVELESIYHSPWTRAKQTAALMQPLCSRLVETPLLAQPPSPELLELSGSCIALVGHEPWLGELCGWLLTGQAHAFPLKKAGVAYLKGPLLPGQMQLKGFFPPTTFTAKR